jgi:hypothetical protein
MGDVPQAPHAAEGGGGGLEEGAVPDPNPSPSLSLGGCSDPVSLELSMGGDYYRACCGDPDPDIPEGPKLPCVGEKVREGGRESPSVPHHPRFSAIGHWLARPCSGMGLHHALLVLYIQSCGDLVEMLVVAISTVLVGSDCSSAVECWLLGVRVLLVSMSDGDLEMMGVFC